LFGDTLPDWSSLARSVVSLARSFTPSGFAAAWQARSGLLMFHALFYLSLLSIVVNLGVSLVRKPQGAA
jgi:hypothetical protein